ncbi:MAG: hypothetical protein ACJ73D_07620 [Pyrinomonadaceae bacterium]
MYRRPKSLEVILAIRTAMSEEAGHDIPTFVEMLRTGAPPAENGRTVTLVQGEISDELRPESVPQPTQIALSED